MEAKKRHTVQVIQLFQGGQKFLRNQEDFLKIHLSCYLSRSPMIINIVVTETD